ncbi:hypothetical protein IWQ60_000903 [Tieghemiomyces parasiticus]|uniref:Uncharacterized protein n=1 Tax=Tieghemiomyces parasiticus TaxID=78921 RepID=A0A9W8DYS6_9FUNG|nr:hypothetical protein IWQ60_001617 [Tieghemiomyces parasiticus]KAJ1929751.1 hypothetical protein IWQ60_000903 [Tieghemiomyces parasiticus]
MSTTAAETVLAAPAPAAPFDSVLDQVEVPSADSSDVDDPSGDTLVTDTAASGDSDEVRTKKDQLKRCHDEIRSATQRFSKQRESHWLPAKRRHIQRELAQLEDGTHPAYAVGQDELDDRFRRRRQKLDEAWALRRNTIMTEYRGRIALFDQTYRERKRAALAERLTALADQGARLKDGLRRGYRWRSPGPTGPDDLDGDLEELRATAATDVKSAINHH